MPLVAFVNSRNQSLDVLRGVAILLVLGCHVPYFSVWHKIGWAGVDLFFVLSGFLISGLLFREFIETGAIDFQRFIVRRGFKIWPALYVYLVLMRLLVAGQTEVQSGFFQSALFVRNYFPMARHAGFLFDHTWSLSVEEHFYLALPLILLALIRFRGKRGLRFIPVLFVVIAVICLGLRVALHPAESYATHFRIDQLFAGVTLGYLYQFHREGFRTLATNCLCPSRLCC